MVRVDSHGILQLLCGSRQRLCVTRVAVVILFAFFLYQMLPRDTRALLLSQSSSATCTDEQVNGDISCKSNGKSHEIPNIVNLVYVLSDPVDGTFPMQFSHYLSIYAAWHRWRPDIIYLHTNVDANSTAVLRALNGDAGKWAQRFFEIPGLVVNTVSVPTHAKNGREIKGTEHKSDFVRVRAVHDFGGIYIDLDVHALRDIRPLRDAGYAAVGGQQVDGYLNSGTFMSEKEGQVVKLWLERMHQVYDGGWTTHSNTALTYVGKQLASHPCQMLRMKPAAFAPVGWLWGSRERLFGDHFEASKVHFAEDGTMAEYPEDHEKPVGSKMPWAHDWRCTFLLHAFSPKKPRNGIKDNGISPRYVVERRSNFARAVYPMLKSMYDNGRIDKHDLT